MKDQKNKAGMKKDHAAKADKRTDALIGDKLKQAVQESNKKSDVKGKRL